MDRVCLEGLELQAPIGVYEHERGKTQRLVISVIVECDLKPGAASDQLDDTMDYDGLATICREVVSDRHHDLIETVAERIASRVLRGSTAQTVEVRVEKPGAVRDCRTVAVEIRRVR